MGSLFVLGEWDLSYLHHTPLDSLHTAPHHTWSIVEMEYCLLFSTYIWCSSGCIFLEDFHFDTAVADLLNLNFRSSVKELENVGGRV